MLSSFFKKVLRRIPASYSSDVQEPRGLREIYERFSSSSEGSAIIKWREALRLHRLVSLTHRKQVLELGTGIGTSTAVLACAVGVGGHVTTVEQNKKCFQLAQNLVPRDLHSRISFCFSSPRAFTVPALSRYLFFSGYQVLPVAQGPFDFLLVDGSDGWMEDGRYEELPNGDVIKLIPHLVPGALVVMEGRRRARDLYRRFLSPYLRVKEKTREWIVFERTNKPLALLADLTPHDLTLDAKIARRYFS